MADREGVYVDQRICSAKTCNSGGVDEATEALTCRGWLTLDKVTTKDLVLGYHSERRTLRWEAISSISVSPAHGRDMVSMRQRSASLLASASPTRAESGLLLQNGATGLPAETAGHSSPGRRTIFSLPPTIRAGSASLDAI